jgi:hypothetical protein
VWLVWVVISRGVGLGGEVQDETGPRRKRS